MTTANAFAALRASLIADADVQALVAGRVFVYELPQAEAVSMPRAAIVLMPGGGWSGVGSRSLLRLVSLRIQVQCYGATPSEAGELYRRAHDHMKQFIRDRRNVGTPPVGVLLHRANLEMSALFLRDPDTDWPFVLEAWDVLASETPIAV